MSDLIYLIALGMTPGIGQITAKKLVSELGSAEAVFQEKSKVLERITRLKSKRSEMISSKEIFQKAEKELEFVKENDIQIHSFLDKSYPNRLKHCADGPLLLYTKGQMNLNPERAISIVGSRKATVKGRLNCEQLVADLAEFNPTIVSGLAYGIDVCAHQAALKNQLETIAVLGSGLQTIYPQRHTKIATEILENGGIVSDYPSDTIMIPSHFAERNRIVAGLADATIVVESGIKGGSMITAGLAMDYNRDVFAYPGRPDDELSAGCNHLIKTNQAALMESAKDIIYALGWKKEGKKKQARQQLLFQELEADEEKIASVLSKDVAMPIDEISLEAEMSISQTAIQLLALEFKGIIRSLPGKMYQLI